MSLAQLALLALAGLLAGTVNTIVGSGSLITFPTLLALGLNPLAANVTNTVGIVFGSISGAFGYRRELSRQRRRALLLTIPTAVGAAIGAIALLTLPARVFDFVVPVLVSLAVLLVIIQPRLSRYLGQGSERPPWGNRVVPIGIFLTAIYGGYFGAAQGVIQMALLTVLLADPIQELNGVKNYTSALANGVAAVIFTLSGHVVWEAAGVLAASSIVGGQVGAVVGRRLNPMVLRVVIVLAGCAALAKLLLFR